MRNFLAIGVALFALARIGTANAADLPPAPVYTKAPPVAAPYSWTGCYVGANGGYGWNNGNSTYHDPNTTGDPINNLPNFGTPSQYIPAPTSTGSSGWLGGAGAGCNWQSQQWVFGVEGDIDGGHISGSNTNSAFSGPRQFGIGPGTFTAMDSIATANEQVALRWLSTIRARGGIALQDRVLLYATGGLAVGGVNSQGSVITEPGMPGAVIWNGSNSTVKAGYVIGGGIEWAFYDRWTAKAEYLWYNLGNVNHPLNCSSEDGVAPCGTDVYPTLGSTSSSVFGSIVRVGLNYKFGGP